MKCDFFPPTKNSYEYGKKRKKNVRLVILFATYHATFSLQQHIMSGRFYSTFSVRPEYFLTSKSVYRIFLKERSLS